MSGPATTYQEKEAQGTRHDFGSRSAGGFSVWQPCTELDHPAGVLLAVPWAFSERPGRWMRDYRTRNGIVTLIGAGSQERHSDRGVRAHEPRGKGMSIVDSALERRGCGCGLSVTSFAFHSGVVPLALAVAREPLTASLGRRYSAA